MKKQKFSTNQKLIILAIFLILISLYAAVSIPAALFKGSKDMGTIQSMFMYLSNHGFPKKFFFVMLFLSSIIEFVFFLKLRRDERGMDIRGRAFRMAQGRQSYGDSHFETPKEYEDVAVIQNVDDAYGPILGQLDLSGKHLINFRMDASNRANSNMAVVGASGTGKTFTFSKNYIYQTVRRRESIVITDPDGGLYADTAGYFMDHGYVVRRLDLSKLHRSDGWDCLKSIMGEDVELNAQLFAQVVISNVSNESAGIYVDGPMALLKALILRVALDHGTTFPPEKKNIESVYSMLQNPGGEDYLDTMFNAENLTEAEMPCLGPYLTFKQGSPNLRGNLITNLSSQLNLFQNKTVCKVLSTDDIDLELPAKTPCAYYCIFPDSHDTYKFLVSLFFSMLFIKLIAFADDQPDRKCPIPVNFLLDEFPSIGKLPDFDRKMATIRKRALKVVMIFQDITQLQHNYADTWVPLLANCSTFLSLGINDQYTSDMVTKRIGDTTIEAKTEQHASTMADLFSIYRPHSTGEGKRALLSYDELFKLGVDESIILFQNHNPILAVKYPHINHPESRKLRKIDPTKIPSIFNTEARQKLREEERIRVAAYLVEHPLDEIDRSYAGCCEPTPKQSLLLSFKDYLSNWLKAYLDKANGVADVDESAEENPFTVDEDAFEIEGEAVFDIQETQSFESPCGQPKDKAIPAATSSSTSGVNENLSGMDLAGTLGGSLVISAPIAVSPQPSQESDSEPTPFDNIRDSGVSDDDEGNEACHRAIEGAETNSSASKAINTPTVPEKAPAPSTGPYRAAHTAPAEEVTKASPPTTNGGSRRPPAKKNRP